MPVLYLQGGAGDPRSGIGRLVHEVAWPTGLKAPVLDADWLAQPFQTQLECVGEWMEDADAVIGYAWGAHLLLCALEGAAQLRQPGLSGLFLSCFFSKGQFTGRHGKHYRLPRSGKIHEALSAGGVLSSCDFRFVHGVQDTLAPIQQLDFLGDSSFSIQRVGAGHRLLGPGEEVVCGELERLRARLMHVQQHSPLVESADCG